MTIISDSSAVNEDRILPQHQAVLTLLQTHLSDPQVSEYQWLDIACGQGQIIKYLDSNLDEKYRSKINFTAFEGDATYLKIVKEKAKALSLLKYNEKIGEIADFETLFPSLGNFNFITLINVVHELPPKLLASLLINILNRLTENGILYIFDMETLNPLELGAIPWKKHEIIEIIKTFYIEIETPSYIPEVSQWKFKSTQGWSYTLQRRHIKISHEEILKNKQRIITNVEKQIEKQIQIKFEMTKNILTAHTETDSETSEDKKHIYTSLYDFWALHKALGEK
ncbi:class I SAM-dependent methyltransferase [Leptospira mtsangambouensis]|uniref:Class I SAM-dependent methyltransferase n=1 Tax=Leptospira mtsangambouensis TaxID=2484912 RepID=A0ABY2NZ41_9LEPT|nr:class I SAM-dependent methyltransferase [Leptospira mtsangambouensis]TGM74273.1 class I SAM-dependent methyltransferase [Leptospira mtsangambouensis]